MPNDIVGAMRNTATLSKPIFLRLNTVGDVVATVVALQLNGRAAANHGEEGIAVRMRSLSDQLMQAVPDDWDCGDPTCESCGEGRGERMRGIRPARAHEPSVEFIIDPEAGEA